MAASREVGEADGAGGDVSHGSGAREVGEANGAGGGGGVFCICDPWVMHTHAFAILGSCIRMHLRSLDHAYVCICDP